MKTGQSARIHRVGPKTGGYDAWGVRLPGGLVREFTTLAKAQMYAAAMEGKDVVQGDGDVVRMTGLAVVHRFIPTWTEIPDDTNP